jgi:colicin import membrane protein
MKIKIITVLMLLLIATLPSQAQDKNEGRKDKDKKELIKKPVKKVEQHQKGKQIKNKKEVWNDDDGYAKEKNKVKANNGKANAFGKDKHGLEGREFGQERARQARLQNQRRSQRLQKTVVIAQRKIPTLRERIENTKFQLLQQKPSLSVEVYRTKNRKLLEAERKLSTLEKMVLVALQLDEN